MATIIVNTTLDENDGSIADGDASLRDALALSNSGDTITFASDAGQAFETGGTIRLSQDLGELVIVSDVTIDGDLDDDGAPDVTITGDTLGDDITTTDPMSNTITDASNNTNKDDNVRVLSVAGNTSNINGLVITGGYESQGGGAWVEGGSNLTLINSSVSGNAAKDAGGGLLHYGTNSGTLTLINTIVSTNFARDSYGGGIWNFLGSLTLTDTLVSGNTAYKGGGINNWENGVVTLTNTTVSDNEAYDDGQGGGIRNKGTLTLIDTAVSGNTANRGGGIDNWENGVVTLTNTTVSDNEAYNDGQGGGIRNTGTLTLTNTTVSGNVTRTILHGGTETNGGGISNSGTATLTNTVVLGNSAPNSPDVSGSITEAGPNLIGGRAADVFAETVDNNGVAAGRLADNGGAVQTIALKNDAANPALDAGQDDRLDERVVGLDLNGDGDTDDVIDTDARGDGFARTADVPGVSNSGANTVDLGAFEVQTEDPGGPDPVPVKITFTEANAYNSNAFGIYDTSTLKAKLLAPDLNGTAEGTVLYEADLTQQQLDTLGFFLIPDGADENANLADLVGEELMVESTADGYTVNFDGTPLAGRFVSAFFSDAALNPGGLDHFVEDGTAARYGLSVEDMAGGGDLDFDDALFLVETGVPAAGAQVEVTFESEAASFRNTFGYFREDTGEAEIVFADIDETMLAPGTVGTFDLTAAAYDKLTFFLIPDGATLNADLFTDLDAIDLVVEEANGALQARDQTTGTVLDGYVNPVYVPAKVGNPDATRHALQVGDVDDFELRWEDLPGGGNADYDDTVVSIGITPDEVLT